MRLLICVRVAAAFAVPVIVSNCALLSGRCTYETRSVHAESLVMENGMEIARGTIDAGATRGSSNSRFFSFDITAAPLDGHITSVALTDASRPGVIVLELPFLPQFQPATIRGVLDQRDNAPTPALQGTFEIVQGNRAVLEVRIDLPDRPVVRMPFGVVMHEPWSRPYCS